MLALSLLALSLVPCRATAARSRCASTRSWAWGAGHALVAGGDSVLGRARRRRVCAGVGAVLALPALRLRGLYLALATLAFAVLMDNVFFTANPIMGNGGRSTWAVPTSSAAPHHRRVLRDSCSPSSWPPASWAWGRCAAHASAGAWWA